MENKLIGLFVAIVAFLGGFICGQLCEKHIFHVDAPQKERIRVGPFVDIEREN